MKTFSEILHEKYGLSASESEQLLAQMERLTYEKGNTSYGKENATAVSTWWPKASGEDIICATEWTFHSGLLQKETRSSLRGATWPTVPLLPPSKPLATARSSASPSKRWRLFSPLPSPLPTSEESFSNGSFWTWKTG